MITFQNNDAVSANVIIVGASTRAAAFSALRAGLRPICFDLFADADARANVPIQQVVPYPDGLIPLLEALPRMPVIYTGGLENRLDLIDFIDQRHELWGNRATVVARSRDPQSLVEAARLAKVGIPEHLPETSPPPTDGSWVLRPREGAGGKGITTWTEHALSSPTLLEPHFFQRKIDGVSYSAVFIAPAITGDVRFVGITRQLVGEQVCNAAEFQWCGNIGPVTLSVPVEHLIRRFGNVLKWKLGLSGIFGVDFILTPEGVPVVIEVNPRYPASVELLEHATGQPLLIDHCRCFTSMELPDSDWNYAHPGEFMGKAVYYSKTDMHLSAELSSPQDVPVYEFPSMTDLPNAGVEIEPGEPVCTLFAESYSSDQTWELLQARLQELDRQLHPQE